MVGGGVEEREPDCPQHHQRGTSAGKPSLFYLNLVENL